MFIKHVDEKKPYNVSTQNKYIICIKCVCTLYTYATKIIKKLNNKVKTINKIFIYLSKDKKLWFFYNCQIDDVFFLKKLKK